MHDICWMKLLYNNIWASAKQFYTDLGKIFKHLFQVYYFRLINCDLFLFEPWLLQAIPSHKKAKKGIQQIKINNRNDNIDHATFTRPFWI